MNNVANITINGQNLEVPRGVVAGGILYERASIEPGSEWLYLDKEGDIDVPVLPDDRIILHGGEVIFSDRINADIGENPTLRKPTRPKLNGEQITREIAVAKLTGADLCGLDEELPDAKLFVDLSGQADVFISPEWTLVIQESDCYITIPLSDDEVIDLEECAKKGRRPPRGQKHYRLKIDGERFTVDKSELSGQEILALAGKDYAEWSLNQKFCGGRRKPVEKDQVVDLAKLGVERFETAKKQAQQGQSDGTAA